MGDARGSERNRVCVEHRLPLAPCCSNLRLRRRRKINTEREKENGERKRKTLGTALTLGLNLRPAIIDLR